MSALRARLDRVPAPLAALIGLFGVALLVVAVRLGTQPDGQALRTASEQVAAPSAQGGDATAEGTEVLPGEVQAPDAAAATAAASEVEPLSEPRRLAVPAIGLDERLIDLGIAADGSMEVPADPDRVGWFDGGARPGGPGPVVIAAHVDSLTGPAVFARLDELGVGDEVVVTTDDGTPARYTVSRIRAEPRDDFPTAQVFGPTTRDVVRLITCHGPYDRGGIGYTENLVVTAVRSG